jgi:uncharacterized protein
MTSRREDDDPKMPLAGPRDQQAYNDPPPRRGGYQRQSIGEAAAKSFIRSIASSIGRILVRSITGRMR